MVVRYFNLERIAIFPYETNTELIINTYAELPLTFGLQSLQAVPRWNAKVVQSSGRVQ
jgi:hypothetical protein